LPSPEAVRRIFALRERGVPVEAIAREVGLSPVSVRHALCLRRLIPAALEAFCGGRLPFARALALSREPPEAQARQLRAGYEPRGAPPGPGPGPDGVGRPGEAGGPRADAGVGAVRGAGPQALGGAGHVAVSCVLGVFVGKLLVFDGSADCPDTVAE
jgi:hypothetical protein